MQRWPHPDTTPLRPFHWREAALCVPALPLLIIGLAFVGRPTLGAIAAGAAFSVGFGAAREMAGRRWRAMILATVGMTEAAVAGTLLGQDSAIFILIAAVLAAICAGLALYDEHGWWVFLQVVIAFFVAGYYAGDVHAAIERGAMTLTGGCVQTAIVIALARLFPQARAPTITAPQLSSPARALLVGHAARAAICVAGSLLLIRPLGLANGYWAPMTALLVLKPRLSETGVRGLARVGGTLAGCVVATGYALLCHDDAALLVLGMALAAGAAFALQKAHYAALTASITATIVLLTSLGQVSAIGSAEHRLIATSVGGGLALLVALLLPHHLPVVRRARDRVG
jgi:hypothetical protein